MIRANRHNIISILDDMKTQFDWATIFKESHEKNIMPQALVEYNGRIIAANSALCKWIGYSRNELQNLTWMKLTVPQYLEADLNLVNLCLKGEIDSYTLYKEYVHKNGTYLPADLYVTILHTFSIFSVNIVPVKG